MEEESKKDKPLILFGKDISKIPCFRNSLFYGITGGLFCGLARFMLTSHALKSVNFTTYSFSFITLIYWIQCRYNYSKNEIEIRKLQELLQKHAILEGVEDKEIIRKELGAAAVDV